MIEVKSEYKLIIDINKLINTDIKIIELLLAPIQIIIKGPKATLGREFIEVINGKKILERIGNLQNKDEIIRANNIDIKVLIIISLNVTKIFSNKLKLLYKFIKDLIRIDGEEKIKELMILNLDSNSHSKKRKIRIKILDKLTNKLILFLFLKYNFLSFEINLNPPK